MMGTEKKEQKELRKVELKKKKQPTIVKVSLITLQMENITLTRQNK